MTTGCASNQPAPVQGAAPDFVLDGKIGVRTAADGGSARFHWEQTGERYAIDLWGAFGAGRTRLIGDGNTMQITDAAGDVLMAGAPEQVMLERLGWTLPVAVLPDWFWGNAASGFAVGAETQDESGRLQSFEQLGWQVSFASFVDHDGTAVPQRVTLERGPFRARVVIRERTGRALM